MSCKKIAAIVLVLWISLLMGGQVWAEPATDYAKPEHWLSRPAATTNAVDVFYLYPTVYQKKTPADANICNVDNPDMVQRSQQAFAYQASAFAPTANLFAPYYRQADAAYTLTLPLAEQGKVVGGIPASDAIAAFDYYIKNHNQGRPFILAGHSQGSNILLYLLSDYMKQNPKVYARMIAAYVIGYSITPEYLAQNRHLKFAEGPDDTGVIVSYNTEAPQMVGKDPVVLPGAHVINPISWTRSETLAPAEYNLGSIDMGSDGQMIFQKNYADARINKSKGVLICSTVDVDKLSPGNQVFPKGIYHHYDYLFYYFNLRENAANRTNKFFKGQ